MGLGVGGTAFGVGMGAMATFGGVVGLGLYGFFQAINSSPQNRIVDSFATFERMEGKFLDRVSWQEAYNQTMVELDFVLTETAAKQKFTDLEIEPELTQLNKNIGCQNQSNFSPPPTETSELQPQQKLIWKCTKAIKAHTASINAVTVSGDGQTFATASSDC